MAAVKPSLYLSVAATHGIPLSALSFGVDRIYRIISEYLTQTVYPGLSVEMQLETNPIKLPAGKVRYLRQQQNQIFFTVESGTKKSFMVVDLAAGGAKQIYAPSKVSKKCPGFNGPFVLRVGKYIFELEKLISMTSRKNPRQVFMNVYEIANSVIIDLSHLKLKEIDEPTYFDYCPQTEQIVAIGRGEGYERCWIYSNLGATMTERILGWENKTALYFGMLGKDVSLLVTDQTIEVTDISNDDEQPLQTWDVNIGKGKCAVTDNLVVMRRANRNVTHVLDLETEHTRMMKSPPSISTDFSSKNDGVVSLMKSNDRCVVILHANDVLFSPILDLFCSHQVTRINPFADTLLFTNDSPNGEVASLHLINFAPYRKPTGEGIVASDKKADS